MYCLTTWYIKEVTKNKAYEQASDLFNCNIIDDEQNLEIV